MGEPDILFYRRWRFYNWLINIKQICKHIWSIGMDWLRSRLMVGRRESNLEDTNSRNKQQQLLQLQDRLREVFSTMDDSKIDDSKIKQVIISLKQKYFGAISVDVNVLERCLQIAILQDMIHNRHYIDKSPHKWDDFAISIKDYILTGNKMNLAKFVQSVMDDYCNDGIRGICEFQRAFTRICDEKKVQPLELVPFELILDKSIDEPKPIISKISAVQNEDTVEAIIGSYNYRILQIRLQWLNITMYKDKVYMTLRSALETSYKGILPTEIIIRSLHMHAFNLLCDSSNIKFSDILNKLRSKNPQCHPDLEYINGYREDMITIISAYVELVNQKDINIPWVVGMINKTLKELYIPEVLMNANKYLIPLAPKASPAVQVTL